MNSKMRLNEMKDCQYYEVQKLEKQKKKNDP